MAALERPGLAAPAPLDDEEQAEAAAPAPPGLYTSHFTRDMKKRWDAFPTLLTIPAELLYHISLNDKYKTKATERLMSYVEEKGVFVYEGENGYVIEEERQGYMDHARDYLGYDTSDAEFIQPTEGEEFEEMKRVLDACIDKYMTPIEKDAFKNKNIHRQKDRSYEFRIEVRPSPGSKHTEPLFVWVSGNTFEMEQTIKLKLFDYGDTDTYEKILDFDTFIGFRNVEVYADEITAESMIHVLLKSEHEHDKAMGYRMYEAVLKNPSFHVFRVKSDHIKKGKAAAYEERRKRTLALVLSNARKEKYEANSKWPRLHKTLMGDIVDLADEGSRIKKFVPFKFSTDGMMPAWNINF